MNVAFWIARGVHAANFLMVGMMNLIKGTDGLTDDLKVQWANDVPADQIRLAGMTTTLGVLGVFVAIGRFSDLG